MYLTPRCCNVCLSNNTNFKHIQEILPNLRYSIPEVEFDQDIPILICITCCEWVQNICAFKEMCLRNLTVATTLHQMKNAVGSVMGDDGTDTDSNTAARLGSELVQAVLEPNKNTTKFDMGIEDIWIGNPYTAGSDHDEDTGENNQEPTVPTKKKYKTIRRKQHICPHCNKCFTQAYNLANHIRTHTGEKPYECETCHKRFTQIGHLQTHRGIHLVKKKYECDVCNRQFSQSFALQQHSVRHTGERPYKCDICNKTFAYLSNYSSHRAAVHNGKRNFECDLCNAKYTAGNSLKAHKKKHHGIKFDDKESKNAEKEKEVEEEEEEDSE